MVRDGSHSHCKSLFLAGRDLPNEGHAFMHQSYRLSEPTTTENPNEWRKRPDDSDRSAGNAANQAVQLLPVSEEGRLVPEADSGRIEATLEERRHRRMDSLASLLRLITAVIQFLRHVV